jgi:DNA-binding MarR family transcriptional regulator
LPQEAFSALAAYRFTGETYSVMLYLMGKLSFDNWINVTQADIGNSLGLARPNVSRAMKVLVEKKIILEGPLPHLPPELRGGLQGRRDAADQRRLQSPRRR